MTPEQIRQKTAQFAAEVRAAILPLVPVCEPWRYDGDSEEYCVFHWIETAPLFAGDRPAQLLFSLTVDWYLPGVPIEGVPNTDPEPKKSQLREALFALRGSWPTVTDAGDEEGQHWVFELEVVR